MNTSTDLRFRKGKDCPNYIHGFSPRAGKSAEYKVWAGMKNRCLNSNEPAFKNYGGRGITVSESWMKFENFIADMGARPTPNHTIERMDNNGNYCASNCVWATYKEQSVNRRGNRIFEHNGIKLSAKEWAARLGASPNNHKLVTKRISKGWSIERAVTTPARKCVRRNHENTN